jgi:hypothetical protein
MPWYQLNDANDPKFDALAKQYNLHPLHLEDARNEDEGVKVDSGSAYTFAVFKPVRLIPDPDNPGEQMPSFSPIDIFAGKDFLITISDPACPTTEQALARARRDGDDEHPGKLVSLILDTIVDLYFPAIDHFDDRIDQLEDKVFDDPSPEILPPPRPRQHPRRRTSPSARSQHHHRSRLPTLRPRHLRSHRAAPGRRRNPARPPQQHPRHLSLLRLQPNQRGYEGPHRPRHHRSSRPRHLRHLRYEPQRPPLRRLSPRSRVGSRHHRRRHRNPPLRPPQAGLALAFERPSTPSTRFQLMLT